MNKEGLIALAAGICMFGVIGTGLGQGLASGRSCWKQYKCNLWCSHRKIRTIMIIGMAFG